MKIIIKNLRKEKPKNPWDIKVDRSSILGNPFTMTSEKDRDLVCNKYKVWFYNVNTKAQIQNELNRLKEILSKYGKLNLFCWCSPKRCHAETIKEYLLEESVWLCKGGIYESQLSRKDWSFAKRDRGN